MITLNICAVCAFCCFKSHLSLSQIFASLSVVRQTPFAVHMMEKVKGAYLTHYDLIWNDFQASQYR